MPQLLFDLAVVLYRFPLCLSEHSFSTCLMYSVSLCTTFFPDWISSLLSRCPTIRWLCGLCTIKPLHLQGLQSVAITLRRADAAVDLSLVEGVLATKERGGDTDGEVRFPQPQPLGRDAERSGNVDSCDDPFDEVTGSALTMDARLVPECATLSVGAFALVCRDDRVKSTSDGDNVAAFNGPKSGASLGILEISSDTSNENLAAATAATAGAKQTSLAVSWNTLTATAGEQPSVPQSTGLGSAKPELSGIFRKLFSRHSVRLVPPTGASMRLGEVRIQCHPSEAAAAKRGAEKFPTSSSCVVVRDISATPSVVGVQPRQLAERDVPIELAESERAQQPKSPPARPTLAGVRGAARESKIRDSAGDSSDGYTSDGGPDDEIRLPPRQSPPLLPPRPPQPQPLPSLRLQRIQVPKVKVHASTIIGNVDAGLAGWLNLRGLHEAEFLAAKARRMAKLVAAGKQQSNSVANVEAAIHLPFCLRLSCFVAASSSKSAPLFPYSPMSPDKLQEACHRQGVLVLVSACPSTM